MIRQRFSIFATLALLLGAVEASGSTFTQEAICKAAISVLMVQGVSIMTAEQKGREVIVSYNRPSDGQHFENKCLIDEASGTVVWAAKFNEAWGRWRNHPLDPVVQYRINGGILSVMREGSVETFGASDF